MRRTIAVVVAISMALIILASVPTHAATTYVKNRIEVYHSADYTLQCSAPHHNLTLGISQTYYLTVAQFGPDVVTMKINNAFVRSISSNSLVVESFRVQAAGSLNITFENQTALKLSLTWKAGYDIIPIPDDDDFRKWLENRTKNRDVPANALVIDMVIPFGSVALGVGFIFVGFVVVGVFTFRRKNRAISEEVAKSTDPSGALSETWEKATGVPSEAELGFKKEGQ